MRRCSRSTCGQPAVATLTYVYADSTAVLGPLAATPVPGAFDLCATHAARTSVPSGWEVIRLPLNPRRREEETDDELVALANAVREIGLRDDDPPSPPITPPEPPAPGRPGRHLRLLPAVE
ncbi:MAG: DUF3499 domain-containing protein [Propionibacteriaceae bacterium]|nr:DUF3499 domain-containing protein [Propionibacteriaceae bacterium]